MGDDAARLRAARGWKHLSQRALADRLGVEEQWVKRREAGKQNLEDRDRMAIAAACEVPLEFMLHGFSGIDYASETRDDRLERLIRQHDRDTKKAMSEGAELQGAVFSTQRMVNQNSDQIARILDFIQELAMTELVELLQQAADQRAGTSGGSSERGDAAGGGGLG